MTPGSNIITEYCRAIFRLGILFVTIIEGEASIKVTILLPQFPSATTVLYYHSNLGFVSFFLLYRKFNELPTL